MLDQAPSERSHVHTSFSFKTIHIRIAGKQCLGNGLLHHSAPTSAQWHLQHPGRKSRCLVSTPSRQKSPEGNRSWQTHEGSRKKIFPATSKLLDSFINRLKKGVALHNRPYKHGTQSVAFASLMASITGKRKSLEPVPAHEQDLQELFHEIDVNNEGFLDAKKLRRALSRVGLPCGKDYLESLMKQYDENHDGRVDFAEFSGYVEKRKKEMERAFNKLDFDSEGHHVGSIKTQNLVKLLRKAGLPASEDDAMQMVSMLDKDKDGSISFQEFCQFCCLLPAAQLSHQNVVYDWMDSADWQQHTEYRLSMVPSKASYERLIAGGIAGAVSRTLVAPFERLRTIMMTESSMKLADAWTDIMAKHGPKGFWRGNTLTVLKTIPQQAIQFAVYDGMKDLLMGIFPKHKSNELSQGEKLLAGCAAGAVTILSTYPLEVLRTRMALAGGTTTAIAMTKQIWREHGPKGFYQGVRCGLLCEVLTVGLGFWVYEAFQSLYRETHNGDAPNPRARGYLGGCSALVVLTCSMPVETVLRRLQVQGHPGRPVLYNGARECFMAIWKNEGPKAFYRGLLSSYCKVVPSIGLTYALYALIVQDWGIGGVRGFTHLDQQDEAALAAGTPAS